MGQIKDTTKDRKGTKLDKQLPKANIWRTFGKYDGAKIYSSINIYCDLNSSGCHRRFYCMLCNNEFIYVR
jgi:hypothetical protein